MTEPTPTPPAARKYVFAALAASLGLLFAVSIFYGLGLGDPATKTKVTGVALVGGPFTLTNQDGKIVSEKSYAGKPMLVYFGYTSCPDVCPIDLHKMARALEILGDQAAAVQPIFISIDPARDDVAKMKAYVSDISPVLQGLTGTPEQIAAAAKAYRVYYAKTDGSGDPTEMEADYWMSHSNLFYLMDAESTYLTHFDADMGPDGMAGAIASHLK